MDYAKRTTGNSQYIKKETNVGKNYEHASKSLCAPRGTRTRPRTCKSMASASRAAWDGMPKWQASTNPSDELWLVLQVLQERLKLLPV